jgi:site-specific DNA recombinase
VDAGPHPNRAHAGWGRRCQRLDPDPVTAPHVRWMFEQRVAGRRAAGIAGELNERGVLCPSDVDPDRHRHRSGGVWTLRTVAVILANPRYTGRQVWNRQRTEHSDRAVTRRLNPAGEWVISRALAHPALVSEAEFVAAQQVRAARPTKDGGVRRYLLAGLLECRLCGRRMDSHWVPGRAGYRCRHGYSSARPRSSARPTSVYVREDVLLSQLVEFESELGGHDVDDGDVRSRLAAIVAWLKAAAMVIVHDGTAWEFVTG